MSDLISRSELDNFFYSETSGTEEIIEDAVMKYSDMEINYPDDCRALCKDIIELCRNVIRTEPVAYDVEKVVAELEKKDDDCGCGKITVFDAIDIVRKGGLG